MKPLIAAAIAISLAGCASVPQVTIMHKAPIVKAPVVKVAPALVVPTPNDQVKKRWFDRFKKHDRWFH